MPERSTFLEQFDRSYQQPPRRSAARGVGLALIVVVLVIGVAVLAWFFLRDGARSAEDWLEVGLTRHLRGDIAGAIDAYQEVLVLDADNVFALYNLGLVAHESGDRGQAESSYRAALEIDPGYVPALFNLALLHLAQCEMDESVTLFRQVIALDDDNADAHLNLGFALRAAGDPEAGGAELGRAIELEPALAPRATRGLDDVCAAAEAPGATTTSTTSTSSTTSISTTTVPESRTTAATAAP